MQKVLISQAIRILNGAEVRDIYVALHIDHCGSKIMIHVDECHILSYNSIEKNGIEIILCCDSNYQVVN